MSEPIFRTAASFTEARVEEKRSEFIAALTRVGSEEEAENFVKERRRKHPDARHTVYAYLLRDGKMRYADDGEPQGSAGLPTLEAIKRSGLSDICIATTRYFGGILLGQGGLTRTYGAAAYAVLEKTPVAEYLQFQSAVLQVSYPDYQKLLQEFPRFCVREKGSMFAEEVKVTVGLPAELTDSFLRRVADLTAGRAVCLCGECYLDLK